MAFDSGKLVSSAIQRIRLTIGDINPEWALLEDDVYEYLLYKNGSDENATAIEALENIINYYSLNPTDEAFGDISGKRFDIRTMERRLKELKSKPSVGKDGVGRVPMMLRSDRKDWNDFNKLFGDS